MRTLRTADSFPGAFLAGFAALWAALYGLGAGTRTGIENGVLTAAAVVVMALIFERYLFGRADRRRPNELAASLGLGRPEGGAVIAAAVTSAAVVGAITVSARLTGLDVRLRPNCAWLVLCLLAYHGIAEEVVWRGYAFGHLRRGRPFLRAVLASTPLLAVTHLPIVLESGVAVGLVAILVAAVTCLPLSHLYELSGGTIWPGALLHASIDCFKLVEPPHGAIQFSMSVALIATLLPFLVFAWRARADALRPHTRPAVDTRP